MYVLVRVFKYVHTAYLTVFLLTFFVGLASTMCMFLLYQASYDEVSFKQRYFLCIL